MGGANGGSFLMRRVERSISSPECFFLALDVFDTNKLWWFPSVFQFPFSACWLLYFMVPVWSAELVVFTVFFFLYQLGYTKKQEERHFRGVITLEVCIAFAFYILCFLLCGSEMVYDYIIFAYSVQQFFFPLVERYTDLAKHGLYVTTKVVRCIAIATYAAKLYSFVGV